jgi:hypothetical protein
MSYANDAIFQTVQQIRTPLAVQEVFSKAWRQWAGKKPQEVRIEPGQTNYKPFRRARVMAKAFVLPANDQPEVKLNLFFHVFTGADAARKEIRSKIRHAKDLLPCDGPPVFLVPQWRTVVWTLPNAPKLRKLFHLMDAKNFRLLTANTTSEPLIGHDSPPKLLRYVPRKRAILTWQHPDTFCRYYAKIFNKKDGSRAARNFKQIDEAHKRGELVFAVPRIVSYNPTCRTLLMTEVKGRPFTELMHRPLPGHFARLGPILANLHSSYVQPERTWTPNKELGVLTWHMQDFKIAVPRLSEQLDAVIARLYAVSERLAFMQNAPIHGNLFGDQILYSSDGIGIVDWDSLSMGDPLYDVGRLIAHLIYIAGREGISPTTVSACAEVLFRSYEEQTTQSIDPECLSWHVATQLLLRGKISSLRKLPEEWQEHLAFVITEAEHVLDGRSRFL